MHEKMQQQANQFNQQQTPTPEPAQEKKGSVGDYIDFEEVK
jgi:hypothetical protein